MAKIWLDDLYDDEESTYRRTPIGYTPAHSVNEAKRLIEEFEQKGEVIELLDLDNDLGIYEPDGGDGHKLLDWLIERETFYNIQIHTSNVVEKEKMLKTIERYWPK